LKDLRSANIRDFIAAGDTKQEIDVGSGLSFKDEQADYVPPKISFTIRYYNQKKGGEIIKASSLEDILKNRKREIFDKCCGCQEQK